MRYEPGKRYNTESGAPTRYLDFDNSTGNLEWEHRGTVYLWKPETGKPAIPGGATDKRFGALTTEYVEAA